MNVDWKRRTRIELQDAMTIVGTQMVPKKCALIWRLTDGQRPTRKPEAKLVGETLPMLLRDIAQWIEENGDEHLDKFVTWVQEGTTA